MINRLNILQSYDSLTVCACVKLSVAPLRPSAMLTILYDFLFAFRSNCVTILYHAPKRYNQEGKTNVDLLEQEIVSGSGISWAICKSAPWPTHITMPASHHSVFYRPDTLPAAQPTASKHWRYFMHYEEIASLTITNRSFVVTIQPVFSYPEK